MSCVATITSHGYGASPYCASEFRVNQLRKTFLNGYHGMTTAIDELSEAVAAQRDADRAKKAAWRYAYYNDPEHPERKERKRWRARECARRNRADGRHYSDNGTVPCGFLRQTERQVEMLATLMAGRRYG